MLAVGKGQLFTGGLEDEGLGGGQCPLLGTMMWWQQLSKQEPQEKKTVGKRATGIAILPHEQIAFPAGLTLLSFISQGRLPYNKGEEG